MTINPLETVGLGKILHIFAAFLLMLKVFPLILENSSFPCIIAIVLNKIPLEIKSLSNFLNPLTRIE